MTSTGADPIVLVVFHCRDGETEKLALAAAVGAVEKRAQIRLRRLEDALDAAQGGEDLKRMRKEYIPPAERDILAADGVVLAASSRDGTFPEWTHFFGMLGRMRDEGAIEGKAAGAVSAEQATLVSFSSALLNLGFVAAPSGLGGAVDRATAQGRRVASIARALKR
jgi:multimeric flavodoxin WrbA